MTIFDIIGIIFVLIILADAIKRIKSGNKKLKRRRVAHQNRFFKRV